MLAKEYIINVLKEQLPFLSNDKINDVANALEKELHLEGVKFINLNDIKTASGIYNPFKMK